MDETDVLHRVKNSFHLGNYKNAFDVWKEAASTGISLSHKTEEQLGTILQRLAVIYLRHNEKVEADNPVHLGEPGVLRAVQEVYKPVHRIPVSHRTRSSVG